jgi:uncharacterized lipoprotein YehR (DUF1307 family)
MEKIQKFLLPVTLALVFILFIKSCGTTTQLKTIKEQNKDLRARVDSLAYLVVTEEKMKNILENTTLWQTLEIEELSDKNKMPINHYKSESRK